MYVHFSIIQFQGGFKCDKSKSNANISEKGITKNKIKPNLKSGAKQCSKITMKALEDTVATVFRLDDCNEDISENQIEVSCQANWLNLHY